MGADGKVAMKNRQSRTELLAENESLRNRLAELATNCTGKPRQTSPPAPGAIEALQESEQMYRLAFSSANTGIAIVDLHGTILKANAKLGQIVGYDHDALAGMNVNYLAVPDDVELSPQFIQQALSGGEIHKCFEKRYIHRLGHVIHGLVLSTLVRDSRGAPWYFISHVQDITRQKIVENELRDNERHLKEAQRLTKLGSWERNFVQDVLYWSDEMYRITELKQADFDNKFDNFFCVIHPDDRERFTRTSHTVHTSQTPYDLEYRLLMADGRIKWVHSRGIATYDDQGRPLVMTGTTQDITERKRAEEKLRRYSQRLVELEEEVRKKLAAELHDEMGPDLTALNFDLTLLRQAAAGGRDTDGLLEDADELLKGISSKVRSIIFRLHPPVLKEYGLTAALNWYADKMRSRTTIRVAIEAAEELPRLSPEQELGLYRIAKEAMTNAAKYSGADRITTALDCVDNVFRLSVVDNGKGFDPSARCHKSWGLTIMQERTHGLGGTFRLQTAPGEGTVIYIQIPKEKRDAAECTDS